MPGLQREGEGGHRPNAVPARPAGDAPNATRDETGNPDQQRKIQGTVTAENLQWLTEIQRKGAEGLREATSSQEATRVARDLLAALNQVEKIFTDQLRSADTITNRQGSETEALRTVLRRLDAMEKKMGGAPARAQEVQGGRTPGARWRPREHTSRRKLS